MSSPLTPYQQLIAYYSNLLIAQFNGLPKAKATIEALVKQVMAADQASTSTLPLQMQEAFNLNATKQTFIFDDFATSGTFTVGYGSDVSPPISWDATVSDLQAAFQELLGPSSFTVSGETLQDLIFSVRFSTIVAPQLFYIASNSLTAFGTPIGIVLQANTAEGVQLDVLGQYVGVKRDGVGANGQSISMSNPDFLQFIRIAIASNNFGSSLATIQDFLAEFFPNVILVFDYANTVPMQLSFLIDTDSASADLIQLVLAQDRLPVPMAVQYSVIGAPDITNFFGLSDYFVADGAQPANTTPLNCIAGYSYPDANSSYRWMDYSYSLKV